MEQTSNDKLNNTDLLFKNYHLLIKYRIPTLFMFQFELTHSVHVNLTNDTFLSVLSFNDVRSVFCVQQVYDAAHHKLVF